MTDTHISQRNKQRLAQLETEQLHKNYKASEVLRAAKQDKGMRPSENRARRRAIAKHHGVFKYPGLFRHILANDRAALDKKTYCKEVANA